MSTATEEKNITEETEDIQALSQEFLYSFNQYKDCELPTLIEVDDEKLSPEEKADLHAAILYKLKKMEGGDINLEELNQYAECCDGDQDIFNQIDSLILGHLKENISKYIKWDILCGAFSSTPAESKSESYLRGVVREKLVQDDDLSRLYSYYEDDSQYEALTSMLGDRIMCILGHKVKDTKNFDGLYLLWK